MWEVQLHVPALLDVNGYLHCMSELGLFPFMALSQSSTINPGHWFSLQWNLLLRSSLLTHYFPSHSLYGVMGQIFHSVSKWNHLKKLKELKQIFKRVKVIFQLTNHNSQLCADILKPQLKFDSLVRRGTEFTGLAPKVL